MPSTHVSCGFAAALIVAGLSSAQAQVPKQYWTDPPPETSPWTPPEVPDVDTTGSVRGYPPVVVDRPLPARPYPGTSSRVCNTTSYLVGETADQVVRVHRC